MTKNPYINTSTGALGSVDLRTAKNESQNALLGYSRPQVGITSGASAIGTPVNVKSQVKASGPLGGNKTPTVTVASGSTITPQKTRGESGKSESSKNGNMGGSAGVAGTTDVGTGFSASGAAQGALSGTAFGPVGAFIGFALGGLFGGPDHTTSGGRAKGLKGFHDDSKGFLGSKESSLDKAHSPGAGRDDRNAGTGKGKGAGIGDNSTGPGDKAGGVSDSGSSSSGSGTDKDRTGPGVRG